MDLVRRLKARGLRVSVTGNRLQVQPWSKVLDADRAALRRHRQLIKTLLRDGHLDALAGEATPDGSAASITKPTPPRLDRRLWPTVGVSTGPDGVPTHPLGDEHAERIVSGEIPYDEARRAERQAREQFELMLQQRRPFDLRNGYSPAAFARLLNERRGRF